MKQKNSVAIKIVLSIVVVLAIIGIVIGLMKQYKNKPSSDPQPTSSQSEKTLPDGTTINTNNADPSKPTSNTGASTANLTITQINQNQSQITIRALVSGIAAGNCTLKLTKANKVISKEVSIQLGPSYYYCNGFVINKSEFYQKGEWELTIYAQGEGKNGSYAQKINIE